MRSQSKLVKLPFSNAIIHSHTGKVKATGHALGTGMGSVLLRTGGGGAGSSYMDIDDYINTTGINPYERAKSERAGKGLSSKLSSKLASLEIGRSEPKPVRKNIVM